MAKKPSSIQIGNAAETLACDYLQQHGLALLERNYRAPHGELDLIMRDQNQTVFVEVRYRRNHRFGSGADSIQSAKQGKLLKTALYYLQHHPKLAKRPVRFDVVSISTMQGQPEIDWIKDAFQAEG